MTVGAALLLYAAVLGVAGPILLRHDGWLSRAPRLGATMLLAASWSVLTALFLAGLTIALPGTALSSGLSDVLGACILRLRAAYATPGGAAVAGAGITLSATIAIRTSWALLTGFRTRRRERRRQRTLIALCGRHAAASETVVLDQPQPAVYCLGGRDRKVILTSGAMELLTAPQLAAVLAHEHAHIGSRHHRALAAAAVARDVLPNCRWCVTSPTQSAACWRCTPTTSPPRPRSGDARHRSRRGRDGHTPEGRPDADRRARRGRHRGDRADPTAATAAALAQRSGSPLPASLRSGGRARAAPPRADPGRGRRESAAGTPAAGPGARHPTVRSLARSRI